MSGFSDRAGRRRAPLGAISTCGATRPEKYQDARIIFTGFRSLELDLGPGREGILLAPFLFASAGSEL